MRMLQLLPALVAKMSKIFVINIMHIFVMAYNATIFINNNIFISLQCSYKNI